MNYKDLYQSWLNFENMPEELKTELKNMDEKEIKDAFSNSLEFGTGGLRGVIGAGRNKVNIFTIAKISRAIAKYLCDKKQGPKSMAIAHDTRFKSQDFARLAANCFAQFGIKVYIYDGPTPTPMLSYAVRKLGCDMGIVVTASHNPSKYNGYKVYNETGCQTNLDEANKIKEYIDKEEELTTLKLDFETGDMIQFIGEDTIDSYFAETFENMPKQDKVKKVKLVYTALHGTGYPKIKRIADELDYVELVPVKEQIVFDSSFSTCSYPNPESMKAWDLSLKLAKEVNADACLATDPDSDRLGIGVLHNGEIVILNGNETGSLMLDYLAKFKAQAGEKYAVIKTIVSTDLVGEIASKNGFRFIDTLTGFKFICEQMNLLKEEKFLFAFEESIGYMSNDLVRDKDALSSFALACQMIAHYASEGKTLIDVLDEIKQKYGYYLNDQIAVEFEIGDNSRVSSIMSYLRDDKRLRADIEGIENVIDYNGDNTGLPKSNVMQLDFANNEKILVRPSGTEPKLKLYLQAKGNSAEDAKKRMEALKEKANIILSK